MPIFFSSFTIKCSARLPAQAIWNLADGWLETDRSALKYVWKTAPDAAAFPSPLQLAWLTTVPLFFQEAPEASLAPTLQNSFRVGPAAWQCIKQALRRLQSLGKASGVLLGLPFKHKHTFRVLFLSFFFCDLKLLASLTWNTPRNSVGCCSSCSSFLFLLFF